MRKQLFLSKQCFPSFSSFFCLSSSSCLMSGDSICDVAFQLCSSGLNQFATTGLHFPKRLSRILYVRRLARPKEGRRGTQAEQSAVGPLWKTEWDFGRARCSCAILSHWHALWVQPQPGLTHQAALRIRIAKLLSKPSTMGSWRSSSEVDKSNSHRHVYTFPPVDRQPLK